MKYDELVKALRETSMDFGELDDVSVMLLDAAAAIEELQADVEEQKQIAAHYEQSAKDWWAEACDYYAIASARDITAEESEELIKKFKKLPVGPIEPIKIKPIKPHWVSVEERLPEKNGAYLVFIGYGHNWIWFKDIFMDGKFMADTCALNGAKVTHWMPIEPPQEVQE